LALPPPRHPGLRLTLGVLIVTLLLSLFLLVALRADLAYAFGRGGPEDLGELERLAPEPALANRWVRAEGTLAADEATRYARPLERVSYRLVRLADNPKLWVQITVPAGMEGPAFVAPSSFVGRLVPVERTSIRHWGLATAVTDAGNPALPSDAWFLIDGESPASVRWTLGVGALAVTFMVFAGFGLVRLTRPVRDA
jgi:hypothetical protein